MQQINGKQVFNNAKWIVICKVMQSVLQLIVGMLCARYLGPSNYGLINYAAAVIAFAVPLMRLGFDSTLVHELVNDPQNEGEILGTSLILNIISSVTCMGGVFAFVSVVNASSKVTIIVCMLYSTSLFFAALEMIQYWYQYKLMSKYSSLVMLCSYFLVSAYKVFLLATAKNVYWFALSHSVEYALIAFFLLIIYFNKNGKLSFSLNRAKQMLNRSKHYIFASLMVVVIQNTDHIMITTMCGKAENGFYSAAITCVATAQFVYYAIIDSFRPIILGKKNEDQAEYEKNISRLYGIVLYMAFIECLVFTLFANIIVFILYGENYANSADVLRILVWYYIFSVMGVVRNVWILAEQKQKYLGIINFSGAVFNIALNLVLIPYFGACGAAFASFLTQFFANFILGFIIKPIRKNNILLLKGINPRFMLNESKLIFKALVNKK